MLSRPAASLKVDVPQRATRSLGGAKRTNRPAMGSTDSSKTPSAAPVAGVANVNLPRAPLSRDRRRIVVILAKAGFKLGQYGLVDAYDRSATTAAPTESHLSEFRPDIVHQCLLALFDSDVGAAGMLQVLILTTRGKVIEVSPGLRPPRTYARFKGLIEKLLTDGIIAAADGTWLMRTTRWSIAPQIPYGAEVYGLHNAESSPVLSAIKLAKAAVAEPVSDALQGGIKNAYGFYCISCTDDGNLDGLDFVTRPMCLCTYPTTPHVACMRLCEGFRVATSRETNEDSSAPVAATTAAAALEAPQLGLKRSRYQ